MLIRQYLRCLSTVYSPTELIVAGIPAYNEEKNIAKVILKAQNHADKIVVVDDGSKDYTGNIAEKLGAIVIRHETNLGYGAAIKSCFLAAKDLDADVLVTIDADDQHNPEEIPKVVGPILSGEYDVVVGSRFDRAWAKEIPRYRLAGLRILNEATNQVATRPVSDSQTGFRAYSRRAIGAIRIYESGMSVSSEIAINAGEQGLRIGEVPISINYEDKPSKHPVAHGLEVLSFIARFAAEKHALLLIGLPGLVSVVIGSYWALWVLERYNEIHRFAIGTALAAAGFGLVGFVAINTALILFALSEFSRRA